MASQKGKPRMISGALRINGGTRKYGEKSGLLAVKIKNTLLEQRRETLDSKCRSSVRSPVSHFLCVDGEQPRIVRMGQSRILLMKPV